MQGWACVCRLGGLGDNLIAASVLAPLKKLGYMVEVVTSESFSCVFQNNPNVDKLSIKRDKDIPEGGENLWNKWFYARGREYMGGLWNLSHSCEKRHAIFEGETSFWWSEDYRRRICAGSYLETAWDICGLPHPYRFGDRLFHPTEEEQERALRTKEKIGGPYMVWALSGSRPDKVWPYSTHAICRIIKELGIPVVMVGVGAQQYVMAQAVQTEVQRSNSSDAGLFLALSPDTADPGGEQHWPTRRTLSQVLLADMVVTPDTGVAWAAAMEPMPKIVMVSHASEENITKHWKNTVTLHADPARVPCWPCHRLHNSMETCVPSRDNPNTSACMADISVETLIEKVRASWIC